MFTIKITWLVLLALIKSSPAEQRESLLSLSSETSETFSHQLAEYNLMANPDHGSPPQCGGVITTSSGQIQYKQFEQVGSNERCIWIIRPVNFTSASVWLSENNTSPESGNLLVTAIATRGSNMGIYFESASPSSTSKSFKNAHMLLVSFTTSSSTSSTGFTLTYYFGDDDGDQASPRSVDVITTADLGYVRHPALQNDKYPNFDLSTFIILPKETCSSTDKIKLRYTEISLEPGNHDSLFLYEFERSDWKFRGRIVSGSDSQLIKSKDMLLLVFSSDSAGSYEGFELNYAVC